MIDNTDSTGMVDNTSALNSTNAGIVAGADPGSWVGITGTLPANLPPANTPGDPAVAAAMAAAGGSSSSTPAGGMSTSTMLALAIGAGAVILGLMAVSSPRRRR
jgi:hypothetical protein